MARKKKDDDDHGGSVNGEVPAPDFQRAARLLRIDVKQAEEKVGEHSQTMSTAYKTIAKECHVNTRAARLAFQLSKESDEKRDSFLRSFRGLLAEMKIGLPPDLVDQAEGKGDEDGEIVPTFERAPPPLATLASQAMQ